MEFRRLAAYVYKKNLRWKKAVELAKADKYVIQPAITSVTVVFGCSSCAYRIHRAVSMQWYSCRHVETVVPSMQTAEVTLLMLQQPPCCWLDNPWYAA